MDIKKPKFKLDQAVKVTVLGRVVCGYIKGINIDIDDDRTLIKYRIVYERQGKITTTISGHYVEVAETLLVVTQKSNYGVLR